MKELYPGVYVLETPATPDYMDSKAAAYISTHTNKRYENFKLAMAQAEMQAKNDQDAFERKLKLSQSLIDSLDDQIKQTQKLSYDLQNKIINTEEAAEIWRAQQSRTDARVRAGIEMTSVGRQITVTKVKGEKADIEKRITDKGSKEAIAKAASLPEAFEKAEKAGWGTTPADRDAIAAEYVAALVGANPGNQDVLNVLNGELEAWKPGVYEVESTKGDLVNKNTTTESYSEADAMELARRQASVGGRDYTPATPERKKLLSDMEKEILDLKAARDIREQQALGMEAPTADLIGDARQIYDRKFERNPYWEQERQVVAARQFKQAKQVERFVDAYIFDSVMGLTEAERRDPVIKEKARQVGIQAALKSLRGGVAAPTAAPVTTPIAGETIDLSGDTRSPYNVLDPNWKTGEEKSAYIYTYDPKTDSFYVISGPANLGAQFKRGTKVYDILEKGGVRVEADDPELGTNAWENMQPEWAEHGPAAILQLPPRLEPVIDDSPVSQSPAGGSAKIGDGRKGLPNYQSSKPSNIPVYSPPSAINAGVMRPDFFNADDEFMTTAESTKRRHSTALGKVLPSTSAVLGTLPSRTKEVKPPPMTRQEEDVAAKGLNAMVGSALSSRPKHVARLVKNTPYGQTTNDIIDSMGTELSDSSRRVQAMKAARDAIAEQFKYDPKIQSKALQLADALMLLHDDSKRAKLDR